MTPLKIEFQLGTPVVIDSEYPIHLDGLLAWSRVQEAIRLGDTNPWGASDDLPIAKAGQNEDWVWQASRLVFKYCTPRQLVNMQRRSEPDRIYRDYERGLWRAKRKDGPPTINTNSGQLRAYQFYTSVQWASHAEAWCVGDPDRVRELLDKIEHIGKMGRNGFGQVSNILVTEDDEALERWRLRVLPIDVPRLSGVDYTLGLQTPRAPYWEKSRRVPMFDPVA